MTLILNDDDVEKSLTMSGCIDSLETAFKEMGEGKAVNVPRRESYLSSSVEDGYYVFKTMEGGVESLKVFAQRINSDIMTFPTFDGYQRKVKIPKAFKQRYVGLVFLYDMETLELLSVLNDGHLQRMRVAGTIGLGIKYLARKESRVVGLFGSGWQAETAIIAACTVRNISIVKVYSPNEYHRNSFADRMKNKLNIEVISVENSKEAIKNSDIIITVTNSEGPIVEGSSLEKGIHLTCVTTTELDEEVWRRSDLIVYSNLHLDFQGFASKNIPLESLPTENAQKQIEHQHIKLFGSKMFPLSDILLQKMGRVSDEQITIMNKGMGLGIEFAATAKRAYDVAKKKAIGKEIPSIWFTQKSYP